MSCAGRRCRLGGAVRRYPAHCVHGPDGEGGESGLFDLLGRMVDACAGRGKRVSGYQRALMEWDEMVVNNAPPTISTLTHMYLWQDRRRLVDRRRCMVRCGV